MTVTAIPSGETEGPLTSFASCDRDASDVDDSGMSIAIIHPSLSASMATSEFHQSLTLLIRNVRLVLVNK